MLRHPASARAPELVVGCEHAFAEMLSQMRLGVGSGTVPPVT